METKSCNCLHLPSHIYCSRRRRSRQWSLTEFKFKVSIFLIVIFLQGAFHDAQAIIKINKLVMPSPIENGSSPAAILDCDYNYEEIDVQGLVVKWYFNSSTKPVYQWIPPQTPEALGSLEGRLDLTHRVTDDPQTMHRALRIVKPTVDLAGSYRCEVSSFNGEDKETKEFIVYVPPSKMEINYTKPTENTVNVTCHVEGMYPEPHAEMSMQRGGSYSDLGENVKAKKTSKKTDDDIGVYDILLYMVFDDKDLMPNTHFECAFKIPNTDYVIKNKIVYFPDRSSASNIRTNCHYGLASIFFLTTYRFLVQRL